jgi:hypothetical protein
MRGPPSGWQEGNRISSVTDQSQQDGSHLCFEFLGAIGGPDRDRTDDLFHAMKAFFANLLIVLTVLDG